MMSKAERGYRLLGPALAASKAHRVALDESMAVASGLQAIGFACLRTIASTSRSCSITGTPQPSIKRASRSALTIHKSVFADRTVPRLNAELRWLAAELGKARVIDVLLKRTEEEVRAQSLEARVTAYEGAGATLQPA